MDRCGTELKVCDQVVITEVDVLQVAHGESSDRRFGFSIFCCLCDGDVRNVAAGVQRDSSSDTARNNV